MPTTFNTSSNVLDLSAVVKASQTLSSETHLQNLLEKLIKIVAENVGGQKGFWVTRNNSEWKITASLGECGDSDDLAISVLNYVERTKKNVVLEDARRTELFAHDPYIIKNQPLSVLCTPIVHQSKLTGILYLENNRVTGAFTSDRLGILSLLTSQVSISIENIILYAREQEKSQQLQESLYKLQQTQTQLVHTEKISSLGQLVAGVAHEVNNPVSFINGNLSHINQYVKDLTKILKLYQKHLPEAPTEIAEEMAAIDLEYMLEDLPQMINSMQLGTSRIKEIMQSLRNFSRNDGDEKRAINLHEGIDATLMILSHRLKAQPERPAIVIIKEYNNLPPVECYPGQLNQVFMNLIANAVDALDESNQGKTYLEIQKNPNAITINTTAKEDWVTITIADNGPGMSEHVREKLFNAFFTTKVEGKGTGLGLSISHQIITEKHGGTIECISSSGEGAKFVITIPVKTRYGCAA
jgi:signal transduction histidine kinase